MFPANLGISQGVSMTTIGALRLKIDTLQLENQHLEAQNLKLAQKINHSSYGGV